MFGKVLTSLVLSTAIFGSLAPAQTEAALKYKAGDILITKSTSSYGLTGHTGIMLNGSTALHIQKPGTYPKKISIKSWLKKYPKTKVVRPKSDTIGPKAAKKASSSFVDKKIGYRITMGPTSIKYTYCSEIVWYSYYKAGKKFMIYHQGSDHVPAYWMEPNIIKPYDFINEHYLAHNGFKFVDNKW